MLFGRWRRVALVALVLCLTGVGVPSGAFAATRDGRIPSTPGQLAPAAAMQPAAARPGGNQPGRPRCPDRVSPPKAVDTSEVPAPGQPSPTPVPVPATPAGGPRMGDCGNILPRGAPPVPPHLGFTSWLLFDVDTGQVLAARNPHARERPASVIKTLLALVVLRDVDLSKIVTGTQADANAQGTRVGIVAGVRYSVRTLLTALLLKSGNDAAHALAMQLGGPRQAVAKMNALAASLGCHDTRAATPSGLDGPGMSTSAYDMATIFRAGLHNPTFAKIVHTKRMRFPAPGGKTFQVVNDNHLLTTYPGDLGGKTGYTDDALHTYLNAAQRDGHRVGLVMLHGMNHLEGMYQNAPELMNYGFTLAKANTPSVGQLGSLPGQTAGAEQTDGEQSPAVSGAATEHGFDPTWIVLGALLGIILVLGLLVRLRRGVPRD